MPSWYFDKKEIRNTPSLIDGIDFDTETRYRREGARFIIDTGTKMDLGYNTTATGVVYFHRFYVYHSFKSFPRYVTACSCLFLAGKVEETPKKCKDIIRTAKTMLPEDKFMQFGEDPKEEVMTVERILLQTIKFDLQVEHPYSFLLRYAKCLKGDKNKLHKMVQMAWTFINDSLCTTLCLQWEPEIIAVALMYLAGKLSKFDVENWSHRQPHHLRWWDMFIENVTMDLLEDICHQVLDLYSQPQFALSPKSKSPPQEVIAKVAEKKVVEPPPVTVGNKIGVITGVGPAAAAPPIVQDRPPMVAGPTPVVRSSIPVVAAPIPVVTDVVPTDSDGAIAPISGYSMYTAPHIYTTAPPSPDKRLLRYPPHVYTIVPPPRQYMSDYPPT